MKHISSTTQMATRRNAATQWRCAAAAAMAGPSCTLLAVCGKPAAAQGPHAGSPHRVGCSRANPIAGIELPECLACSNSRPGTPRNNRDKSRGLTPQP